mmetsp:Transcript_110042/g.194916  ORF Transcript_110042/g.194916 Transcript_110042/m.194916 type:complete len:309 (+) Transcript_110042:39-965(+)
MLSRALASPQRCRSLSPESSSGSSSANEYAEGLGCADSKACRRRASSNFEFDRHPREEYFEEPESFCAPSESDDEIGHEQLCGDRHGGLSGAALMSALADLEKQEDASAVRLDRDQFVRQKLASFSRRAERRLAKRTHEADPAHRAPEAKTPRTHLGQTARQAPRVLRKTRWTCPDCDEPNSESRRECNNCLKPRVVRQAHTEREKQPDLRGKLQEACTELAGIRGRIDTAGVMAVPDRSHSLQILGYLASVKMNAALLKSSGLGLELNRSAWKRHPLPEFTAQSSALVRKWRANYRQQRQQQREAGA